MRRSILGVAALALLAFGASACTQGSPTGPSATPKTGLEALNEALSKTKGQSYAFTVAYGTLTNGDGWASGDGATTQLSLKIVDAASGVTVGLTGTVLTSDVYVKADLGVLGSLVPGFDPAKWMHIDPAKAPGAARVGIKPGQDTFGPETYLKGATEATAASATEITGKLDITKAAPVGVPADQLANLSATEKMVAFTATLDDQGRVSKLVLNMPKVGSYGAADLVMTYSNWGVPASPAPTKPPAAQTVEAPELIYSFLR
jgi:hypothetical protein